MKILICGLPGSGKTTLAKQVHDVLSWPWFNADIVRKEYNDWDFSVEGRIRQCERMKRLADECENSICDFVAPTQNIRDLFDADIIIWMNTIRNGRFEDTNKVFETPNADAVILDFNYDIDEVMKRIECLIIARR